jgi:hypothetical protein
VGAELDPREERLETVAIVLFWIPTVPPNLRHHTFGAELCQARKSPDMSFFVLSFSSFISIIDSHPIPNQLIESFFPLLYFSFFVVQGQGSWT